MTEAELRRKIVDLEIEVQGLWQNLERVTRERDEALHVVEKQRSKLRRLNPNSTAFREAVDDEVRRRAGG